MTVGFLSVHFVGKLALLHNSLFPGTVFHLYPVPKPRYFGFLYRRAKNGGAGRLLTLPSPPPPLELRQSII